MSNNTILNILAEFSNEIGKYGGEIDSIIFSENIYQSLLPEAVKRTGIYGNPGDTCILNLPAGPVEIKSSKKREIAKLKAAIESAQAKLAKLEAHNEKE
jgi:hypothetical protein